MIHVKRTTTRGFTQVANTVLRNEQLSLKAKGLLVQLLSHEDGWQQSIAFCSKECSDGREAIGNALRELETAGYVQRTRRRGAGGRWVWDHEISDEPIYAGSTIDGFPVDGKAVDSSKKPLDEEPQDQNQDLTPLALRAKQRNPQFDALAEIEGLNLEELDKSTSTRLGVALARIQRITPDLTPGEIFQRAKNYATHFPDATLTANALAKWWPKVGAPARNGREETMAERIARIDAERATRA